jgi:hypothetical protein
LSPLDLVVRHVSGGNVRVAIQRMNCVAWRIMIFTHRSPTPIAYPISTPRAPPSVEESIMSGGLAGQSRRFTANADPDHRARRSNACRLAHGVCVCVRACVRACVCVRARARVYV